MMKRIAIVGSALLAASLFGGAANAQQTIKIGVILPLSGQFADTGVQLQNGIKLYMKEHGDTIAGKKIEIITKDTGGINPPVAKRLAQELVTRDQVDILAGFALTPNALAAADVSAEAKKFMVNMNAATAIVITKSPYMVRTSMTIPQLNTTLGTWAEKNGVKKAYTMVADFGPGIDAEGAFNKGFTGAGGAVAGSVRMAVANPDFSAYVARAKDLSPAMPGAFGKALAERGIDPKKTKVMGQMEITDEHALASMGDAALGIITTAHYDYNLKSKKNADFVKAYNAEFKRNPDFFSVGGYDGMHVIYATLTKTKGKADGESLTEAAKGLKWESPRGPMSIDPETRDVVQNVYIRRVEKVGGKLVNVEIAKFDNVKSPK
jgi:branched-chain amino acid transport system substrate-binding protein